MLDQLGVSACAVDSTDNRKPLLALAADCSTSGMVSLLLAHGSAVDQACHRGLTALMLAARREGAEGEAIVGLLLAAGATVDLAQSANGWTALMIASWWGRASAAALLLAAGANLLVTDTSGRTAAALAADRGHAGLAAQLQPPGCAPALHHLWPDAFQEATRQLLLAQTRASTGPSLAALPHGLLLRVLEAAVAPAAARLR